MPEELFWDTYQHILYKLLVKNTVMLANHIIGKFIFFEWSKLSRQNLISKDFLNFRFKIIAQATKIMKNS